MIKRAISTADIHMSRENQHWVPKFLIRNFVASDGKVFRLDKRNDEVRKIPPRDAASEIGFNEFLVDGTSVSFEDTFERIETKAAPSIAKILKFNSANSLSQNQRMNLATFIAAQAVRTEAFHRGFSREMSRQDFGAILQQVWIGIDHQITQILRRKWAVMRIDTKETFYLGDNPVTLQVSEFPNSKASLGVDVAGVELHLPLSPKCSLYLPCPRTAEEIERGYANAQAIHRKIRTATMFGEKYIFDTKEMLQIAQKVMLRAKPIVDAFNSGNWITASPDNIENFNYLQCSWASSWIFSNEGDFTFAKRVFRETPDYRGMPSVKFARAFYVDKSNEA